MKLKLLSIPIIISACILFIPLQAKKKETYNAKISIAFNNDCDELFIHNIKYAKTTIYGAIYSLTNKDIVQALIDQANKKIKIHLKIDKEQSNFIYTKKLIKMMKIAGIKITLIVMKKGDHMHNKFAVIDKEIVITGSFNWTRNAAEDNYENIISIHSKDAAQKFINAWYEIQ